MKTKAYPPVLAACALLSAPVSAGASTLETFTVSGTYPYFLGVTPETGTLSGTFDYNGGVFSNFAITATGWPTSTSQSDLFNTNDNSSNTQIQATASSDSFSILTLIPTISLAVIAPGGSTTFSGSLCMTGSHCNEFPVGTLTASAASTTPLPTSLPLFAGGLGAMALLRRLRRRTA